LHYLYIHHLKHPYSDIFFLPMIQHNISNKYGMCSFSHSKIKHVKQLANANSKYAIMIFSTKANMTSSTKLFQYGNATLAYKLYVNIWLHQMDSIIIIDMNPLTKNSWDIPRNPPLLHQLFGLICICEKTKFEVGDTCTCFLPSSSSSGVLG
jgi:hypothetical protein